MKKRLNGTRLLSTASVMVLMLTGSGVTAAERVDANNEVVVSQQQFPPVGFDPAGKASNDATDNKKTPTPTASGEAASTTSQAMPTSPRVGNVSSGPDGQNGASTRGSASGQFNLGGNVVGRGYNQGTYPPAYPPYGYNPYYYPPQYGAPMPYYYGGPRPVAPMPPVQAQPMAPQTGQAANAGQVQGGSMAVQQQPPFGRPMPAAPGYQNWPYANTPPGGAPWMAPPWMRAPATAPVAGQVEAKPKQEEASEGQPETQAPQQPQAAAVPMNNQQPGSGPRNWVPGWFKWPGGENVEQKVSQPSQPGSPAASEAAEASPKKAEDAAGQMPSYPQMGPENPPQPSAWQQPPQPPEWVQEMRKQHGQQMQQPGMAQPTSPQAPHYARPMMPPQPPEWVKEMQKQHEQQMRQHPQMAQPTLPQVPNYEQPPAPPQPPEWVQEMQKQHEQQMQRHQQMAQPTPMQAPNYAQPTTPPQPPVWMQNNTAPATDAAPMTEGANAPAGANPAQPMAPQGYQIPAPPGQPWMNQAGQVGSASHQVGGKPTWAPTIPPWMVQGEKPEGAAAVAPTSGKVSEATKPTPWWGSVSDGRAAK